MTVATVTRMFEEAAEAPARIAEQLRDNAEITAALVAGLRASPPKTVVTLARGSSDNAATYARYLIETHLGIITASTPPSVSSIYNAAPNMADTFCLAISQSGRSPDLIAAAGAAAASGARVVALVNDAGSPLAELAHVVVPLRAGAERSVAATKSFIAALAAIAQLVGQWAGEADLLAALDTLPAALEAAWSCDWSDALPTLVPAQHLYVVGRGAGLAVAQEAALKFKETCGLHAEAFSAAEVRHGPMTLAGPGFPVFVFVPSDASRPGVEAAMRAFVEQGAGVIGVGVGVDEPIDGATALPTPPCHPALAPIVQAQAFYRLVERLAHARGFDPDGPQHLAKVTRTL